MKVTELHQIISRHGWSIVPGQGKGSHLKYEKDGVRYVVPFHKGKEIPKNFANRILKDLGINEKS
jgi:predicted RNA binding protein YcfA (HicA-like mRNA interferase family)